MSETPPVEQPEAWVPPPQQASGFRRRGPQRFTPAWSTLALALSLALAAASLAAQPPREEKIIGLAPGGPSTGDTLPDGNAATPDVTTVDPVTGQTIVKKGTKGTAGTAGSSTAGSEDAAAAAACGGDNGGSTDTGVTATEIKLGSTVVQSGIGASFLGDVRFAMEAIKEKTNAAGGICGRQLKLILKDDGWEAQRGAEFIRNLVEDEKVFALAVVPSSEGLKQISDSGYLKEKKIPTVGTDGMLIHQYTDPYIWPVAASTISTMHIMVKQAHDSGTKQFGLVYESNYHFGIEGAFAFNAAVKRVTGSDVPGYSNPLTGQATCQERFCGINSNTPSYPTEAETFQRGCDKPPACDFMALLLEPTTAIKWMKERRWSYKRMGGPQPLFTYNFGNECGERCDKMWLWTGYLPPIGDFETIPQVATYVNDIKNASSSADATNSFVEGGYVGMSLVVESLKKTGSNLTRERLKATLDSMTLDTGLAPSLKWTAGPGGHFANTRMRAFSIVYKSGFAGWRDEQVEMEDPWIGQDQG